MGWTHYSVEIRGPTLPTGRVEYDVVLVVVSIASAGEFRYITEYAAAPDVCSADLSTGRAVGRDKKGTY